MNTFRTKQTNKTTNLRGGKKKEKPFFILSLLLLQWYCACKQEHFVSSKKKKKRKKTHKKIIIKRKTLTRDGCKNYTHAQRPDTTPILQSWAGIPLSGLGTDKFFWVLFFFCFLHVHSSGLVLVHRALNLQTRGRNNVPFIFYFSLEALHRCTLDPANDTCVRMFF